MSSQYDLCRLGDGTLVVVLQSSMLDEMRTRVVAPLLPLGSVSTPIRNLNPVVEFGDMRFVLMPQLMATVLVAGLGQRVGNLAANRDEITRAVDVLHSGV